MPCLSKRYDRITTTLAAENFPNETWPFSSRNPQETSKESCVTSPQYLGGVFITNQGQKAGKREVKIEWTSRLRYTNTEMNTEKKSLSNKCRGKKRSRKRKRQTKSTSSLINLLYFSDNSHAKQAKKSDATPKRILGNF